MTPEVREELLNNIKRRMTPQPVKIRAREYDRLIACVELDVRCTGIDGVEAIKSSLAAGEACSTDEVPIKVTYLAAPYYVLTADALDKKQGFDAMERALNEIKNTLEQYRWSRFKIEKEAKLVSETDDRDFAALMAKAEKENEMVSGDEDEGEAPPAASDDEV
ncbi:translation initiation factor 2, alpha subunit [Jimgerdemannia flammicorona]|uniref:Translation initiation factor 2, alpha subunit n=1 Tax=Jimgerdemannia flammicorona TaxID=994334 RepID=A0A433DDA5_9FUNG|nr:translation initiation factor 2, alpha subunit [Jimgerdemannia flammicorona]